MCQNQTAQVVVNGHTSKPFPTNIGTRQENTLSPTEFNIFIDPLANKLNNSDFGIDLPSLNKKIAVLLYADDIVLVAPTAEKMQKLLAICTEWADEWHMFFGVSKCGILRPRDDSGVVLSTDDWGNFLLQNQIIPFVDTYKYLGVTMRSDLVWDEAIKDRVLVAEKATNSLNTIFAMPHLSIRAKVLLYHSLVQSAALYGCEAIVTSSQELAPLSKACDAALRRACSALRGANAEVLRLEFGMAPLLSQIAVSVLSLINKWKESPPNEILKTALTAAARPRTGTTFGKGRSTWMAKAQRFIADKLYFDALTNAPIPRPRRNLDAGVTVNDTAKETAIKVFVSSLTRVNKRSSTKNYYAKNFVNPKLLTYGAQPYLARKIESKNTYGARMLLRMRVSNIHLNKYLHIAKIIPEARCNSCHSKKQEGRKHFLLHCSAYDDLRKKWLEQCKRVCGGNAFASVWQALEGKGEEKVTLLLGGNVPDLQIDPYYVSAVRKQQVKLQLMACDYLADFFRKREEFRPK